MSGSKEKLKIMRNKIKSSILITILLIGFNSCQSPEEPIGIGERKGINSISATLPYENSTDNNFPGEIDYEKQIITIVFPYNYPKLSDNILPYECLKKVKLSAKIDNNIIITPALLYFDLTQENYITIKDNASGITKDFKLVAEIRKNNQCTIDRFLIPSKELSGVIDEKNFEISIISVADIGKELAEVTLSHGATCEPDINKVALNYDEIQTIKVIAQNGVDYNTYKIKRNIPNKVPNGIRPKSGKILWAKKLSEIGITTKNKVTSLAVLDNYVVINERGNSDAIYLNNVTGEVIGKMNLGNASAGDFSNYYMTSDRSNNILICNYTPSGGNNLIVWRVNGLNGVPEKYIEYEAAKTNKERYGWAISIQGDLDKDALITTPVFYQDSKIQFARWQVIGGVLQSQMPEFVVMKSLTAGNWFKQADIVYSDASNVNSDYFLATYTKCEDNKRYFYWYNGLDNTIKDKKEIASTINGPVTAVDYIQFNNSPYVAHSIVNAFTYGVTGSDIFYMYDLSIGSLGSPIELCETKLYGGIANGAQNVEAASDVVLRASKDGYYLYAYFMFANGYVVCKQFDCIDM